MHALIRRSAAVSAVAGALVGAGCQVTDESCPVISYPSFTVDVRDATTGAPAAWRAIGIAQDGAFLDTLDLPVSPADSLNALTLYGPFERPGTYSVLVHKPGYLDWMTSGVVVEKTGERCPHVTTVRLEARLQRSGPRRFLFGTRFCP